MCGQASISVSEAMELCPRELHFYLNGVMDVKSIDHRNLWEATRFNAYYAVSPYWDSKKNGTLTFKKLLTFPWEKKEPKRERISLEDFERIDNLWTRSIEKM